MNNYLAIDSEKPTPLQPKWSDVDMCEFQEFIRKNYWQYFEYNKRYHNMVDNTLNALTLPELLQLFIQHKNSTP